MTADELKESIFMALGAASMCWDPLPSNQVFEPTRAKEIGDKLVEKLLPILSQCEAMRVVVEAAKKNQRRMQSLCWHTSVFAGREMTAVSRDSFRSWMVGESTDLDEALSKLESP